MRDYARNFRPAKLRRVLTAMPGAMSQPLSLFLVMNAYPYPTARRRHHVIVVAPDMWQAKQMAAESFARAEEARARRDGDAVFPDYSDPAMFDVVRLSDDVGQGGVSEVWE